MRLIKPSFEIIEQQPGILGLYKQIELAGRTCYRSEDKITLDSAKGFVDRMIKSGHGAILEHGTVYLLIPQLNDVCACNPFHTPFEHNKYSKEVIIRDENKNKYAVVSTNMRVIIENNLENYLQFICEPTEFHEKRVCVRFTCDRGILAEFTRHRTFSFAAESTRYCNYSKNKFGNELTFIIPTWMDTIKDGDTFSYDTHIEEWQKSEDANTSNFLQSIAWAEKNYLTLIHNGWKPQQARAVLPNSLKTELVMTGFVSDWIHFFKLRDAGSAHPQAQELAKPLHEEFIRRKYVIKGK